MHGEGRGGEGRGGEGADHPPNEWGGVRYGGDGGVRYDPYGDGSR